MNESKIKDKKFTEWHSIPREKIKWHPTVDESKCIGCGMCVVGCGRKLYDFDFERNKPMVARPMNCMVGCTTCAVTCLRDAISFPNKEYVRDIIRKENLLSKSKEKLKGMVKW